MDKVYLALYKHKRLWHKEPIKTLTDPITRCATRGKYSHCELVIARTDFVSGGHYAQETTYHCFSASVQDGGVRRKVIDVNNGRWDLIALDVEPSLIQAYFTRTQGAKYDWWGAIGCVLGIKQKRSKYFCSEWCFNALFQSDKGWRFSPNDLAVILGK